MWLHVRVLASRADLFGLGDGAREDSQVDSDLDLLSVLDCRQQETIVLVSELERSARWHLFGEVRIVVLLVEDHWLLRQSHVLKDLLQVQRPLANVVVRLEEVEVPRLHDENHRVLSWGLDIEEDTPVE